MRTYDIVIIGAGPAGLSTAITCRKYDLDVVVLDEFPRAGGRLLGQLHEEPDGTWWNGIKESEQLHREASQLNTDILLNVSVHHIEKNNEKFNVHTNKRIFTAKNV